MPMITLANDTPVTVTLTEDELWQCQDGQVKVAKSAGDPPQGGVLLIPGDWREFASGDVVTVFRATSETALVWRDPK